MAELGFTIKSDLPEEAPLTLDPTLVDVDDNAVRRQLSKRLADVICIPSSQLTPQERHMAGDVLVELLRSADADIRESVAKRLVMLNEAPRTILHQTYVGLLVKRDELRPSHGLTMFWWASTDNRKKILHRFAVTRNVLQESCADLFPKAAADGWSDAGVRKALQFIERRQRNRAAISRSEFEGLEAAIDVAETQGLTRQLTEEISYMSGIKPATGAQILTDKGGEGIAILCKAPGLKRTHIEKLWRALKRPMHDVDGSTHPSLDRVLQTYNVISTDKAQTVLRYWNWSLTASLSPEVLRYIKNGVIPREEEFGAAAITAALVFGHKS